MGFVNVVRNERSLGGSTSVSQWRFSAIMFHWHFHCLFSGFGRRNVRATLAFKPSRVARGRGPKARKLAQLVFARRLAYRSKSPPLRLPTIGLTVSVVQRSGCSSVW
jgi:hypothetical protein